MVNSGAHGFISGQSLLNKILKNESGPRPAGANKPLNHLKIISFSALIDKVKGMYFWTKVDALKSVKYVSKSPC